MATQSLTFANAVAVATIVSGQTASGEVDLQETTLMGLYLPATFTGTAISFTAAPTAGGTSIVVQDGAGATYSVTVAASKYVPVDYTKLAGLRFIKIVSNATEGGTRTINLAARPV